jgi:hypothetical protein
MEVDVRWPIVNINKINNKWRRSQTRLTANGGDLGQDKIDPSTISKPCKIKFMTSTRSNGKEHERFIIKIHLI